MNFKKFQSFNNIESSGEGSESSGEDHEVSTTEVACQFVPPVLRDTSNVPSGEEESLYSAKPRRSYGTRPGGSSGPSESNQEGDESLRQIRASSSVDDNFSYQNYSSQVR